MQPSRGRNVQRSLAIKPARPIFENNGYGVDDTILCSQGDQNIVHVMKKMYRIYSRVIVIFAVVELIEKLHLKWSEKLLEFK